MKKGKLDIDKKNDFLTELLDKFTALITSGFGLVAALAWNDAIQAVFKHFIPAERGEVWAKIIYAILVTFIVVLIVYQLSRLAERLKKGVQEVKKISTKKSYFAIIKMKMKKLGKKEETKNAKQRL